MFHYIIFFIGDNHHQSKAEISKIIPDVLIANIFCELIYLFTRKTTKYGHTKSYILDKHHMKKIKTLPLHIL